MGFFPVDAETLRYLERTGRSEGDWSIWSNATTKEQGLFRTAEESSDTTLSHQFAGSST